MSFTEISAQNDLEIRFRNWREDPTKFPIDDYMFKLPNLRDVIEDTPEFLVLNAVAFSSILKGRGKLSLRFRSTRLARYSKEDMNTRIIEEELCAPLRKLIAEVRPFGVLATKVEGSCYGFSPEAHPLPLAEAIIGLTVELQPNRDERESLTEAFWRVLGEYLDTFQISRKLIGADMRTSSSTYVKVPDETGKSFKKVYAENYMREQAGF